MKEQTRVKSASVFGIDIGKNVFHVVGVDAMGSLSRECGSGVTPCCSSSNGQHQL